MSTSNKKVVRIDHKVEKTTLSKAQKKFNSLISKIDMQKKLLQEWQETIPQYQQRVNGEYETLWENYNNHRVELVHLLDEAYGNKLFKKTDKAKIKDIIGDITIELIQEHGKEEVKELYNRYSDSDFDSESQEMDAAIGDMMKTMMQDMFDIEFADDLDMSSPEKMREVLEEKLQEREEQQRQHEEKRSSRKKTAKQLEKEAKQKQEEQNTSKSIQEIFRKLAAALHPDRELDEVERERKTKIMQKVNVAYAKKDLLQLLALQLEFEQIDQSQLNSIAEDRLKHFNKILQDQLNELDQEIDQIEFAAKLESNTPPYLMLSPKQLLRDIDAEIKEMQRLITAIQRNLKDFQNPTALKAWLKSYRL